MVLCDTSLRNEELLSESGRPRAGGGVSGREVLRSHTPVSSWEEGRLPLGDLSGKVGVSSSSGSQEDPGRGEEQPPGR